MLAKRRCLNSWPRRTSRISRLHKDSISSRCNRKASNWTCGILAGNEKLGLIGEIISRFVVISNTFNFSPSNVFLKMEKIQYFIKTRENAYAKVAYNCDFTNKNWENTKKNSRKCKGFVLIILISREKKEENSKSQKSRVNVGNETFSTIFLQRSLISSFFRWLIE